MCEDSLMAPQIVLHCSLTVILFSKEQITLKLPIEFPASVRTCSLCTRLVLESVNCKVVCVLCDGVMKVSEL